MNFAVIGETGMFGSELIALLRERGLPARGFNRSNLDVENLSTEEIGAVFEGFDVIVNAVAYTAVDKAEQEIYETNNVNAIFPGKLSTSAEIAGARFVHISSDYVFDGASKRPYKVDDQVDPQNEYGRSKALGEQLVQASGADYSILRTAWLYGSGGRCFPKIMADLLEKNGSVRVVSDQFGQPTWTRDLAEQVIQVAILESMPRIVHAVSSGVASWADFAREVAISLGMDSSVVEDITTAEYPTAAKRPAWSVLDNSSDDLKIIGDWRERWHVASSDVFSAR
jgi:dTDP-4-dehydrorhamnose reductase